MESDFGLAVFAVAFGIALILSNLFDRKRRSDEG
jgi:hypothetical protein